MKFGQLIEHNIRNIFLGKSYTKCSGETIPRPFSKKKAKLSLWISGSIPINFIQLVFIVCYVENHRNIWINGQKIYTICFYCTLSWGPSKYVETSLKQVSCLMSTLECLIKGGNGTNGVLENSWGVAGKFLKI